MLYCRSASSGIRLFQPTPEKLFAVPVLVEAFDADELNYSKRINFQGTSWKVERYRLDSNEPIVSGQTISIIGRRGNTLLIHVHGVSEILE